MNYTYNESDRGRSVAVFVNGNLTIADESHPNFDRILSRLRLGLDPSELFDVESSVREAVESYSDRVEVKHGAVYLDDEPVTNRLADVILKVLRNGKSARPYVKFLENLADNPSHRSRTQLYDYLDKHDFQITSDGCFVAYKGLNKDGRSVSSGTAYVDGVKHTGRIPNAEGSVVTMPRSSVSDDPNVACHQGLHAGAWAYANTFGSGNTVKVKIDPADVVSVPADSDQQKLRTCRYEVLEVTIKEHAPEDVYYDDEDIEDAFERGYERGQSDAANGWVV